MPNQTFHFLNVKEGDCSIIEHASGNVSVIDICNAKKTVLQEYLQNLSEGVVKSRVGGNFNQKAFPVNPIEYLKKFNITSIFRFILTHPDMDHMDGLKLFLEIHNPINFWDTDNNKEMDFTNDSPYNELDWLTYKNIRDNKSKENPKRITLLSGQDGAYWNQDADGNPPGDALNIIAPTTELIQQANESALDYNDASYVILYRSAGGKILFSGDSHDNTWKHLLENHKGAISNVDLLIAPHHGRKSGRDYSFLDVVKPKMTFFGNARSEHLAYGAWTTRNLSYITNNQADCMVVDTSGKTLSLYVTNETFAKAFKSDTTYNEYYKGWYLCEIN